MTALILEQFGRLTEQSSQHARESSQPVSAGWASWSSISIGAFLPRSFSARMALITILIFQKSKCTDCTINEQISQASTLCSSSIDLT